MYILPKIDNACRLFLQSTSAKEQESPHEKFSGHRRKDFSLELYDMCFDRNNLLCRPDLLVGSEF
jgi:hypothetical protein